MDANESPKRRYYGFQFADGRHTTTGGDHGVRLHIAGLLFRFSTTDERDSWVSEGYSCRVPRDHGYFRQSCVTRDLPLGWVTADAEVFNTFEHASPGARLW